MQDAWGDLQIGALLSAWLLPLIWSLLLSAGAAWRMLSAQPLPPPYLPQEIVIVVPSQPAQPFLDSCIATAVEETRGRSRLHLSLSTASGAAVPSDRFRQEGVVVTSSHSVDKLSLVAAADISKADRLLLLDDNVRVNGLQLAEQFNLLADGADAVAAPVFAIDAVGWWAHVDAAAVNGYFTRMQIAGATVGISYVTGKALAIKGGQLASFLDSAKGKFLLCDDAALQRYVEQNGGCVALSRRPCLQWMGYRNLRDVWERHKRWGICRKENVPLLFFGELFLFPLTSLVASFAVGGKWLESPMLGLTGTFFAFLAIETAFLLASKVNVGFRFPLVWLLREFAMPLLWISSLLTRRLLWRANSYGKVAGEWVYLGP